MAALPASSYLRIPPYLVEFKASLQVPLWEAAHDDCKER